MLQEASQQKPQLYENELVGNYDNNPTEEMRPRETGKYQNMDTTKIGNERGNSYHKNEKISK